MEKNGDSMVASSLCCHYGDTYDVFLIGDLVQPRETLMACVIHHWRHVVNLFRFTQNSRLYLAKVFNRFMDNAPIKISIYVIDVISSNFL
jgi:hypothetical protein